MAKKKPAPDQRPPAGPARRGSDAPGAPAPGGAPPPPRRPGQRTLRDFVEEEFAENPSYGVFLSDESWFCPYCREPVPPRPGAGDNYDEAILLAVCGHLGHGCREFHGGTGVPNDLETLRRAANIWEFDNFIRTSLRGNAAWQVFDAQRRWWCPYSGLPVDLGIRGDTVSAEQLIPALKTYLKTCKPFKGGKGTALDAAALRRRMEGNVTTPIASASESSRRLPAMPAAGPTSAARAPGASDPALRALGSDAARARAQEAIQRSILQPLWNVFTADGRWLCPYSGKVTEVRRQDGEYTLNHRARDTLKWLLTCAAFASAGAPLALDALQAKAAAAAQTGDLAARLRGDPVWQCADDYGYWICPYCRHPQVHILLAIYALDDDTVAAVRAHVEEQCPACAAGTACAASVEEVYQATGRKVSVGEELHRLKAKEARADETMASLNKARTIQMKMIPKKPKIPGLEVEVVYRPHSEVSGDFYDFIQVSDHEWGFLVADVSGHGLEAAMVMSMAKSAIAMAARGNSSPHEVMCLANDTVQPQMIAAMFITVFYGIYHTETRELRQVRCGHNPTLVVDPSQPNHMLREYAPEGMAVGMVKGAPFAAQLKEEVVRLEPGQFVLQYTDGLIEAMNAARDEYEMHRFRESLRRHARQPLGQLLQALEKDVLTFTGGLPVDDDVTILGFRVV